jgi:hypothetical protein
MRGNLLLELGKSYGTWRRRCEVFSSRDIRAAKSFVRRSGGLLLIVALVTWSNFSWKSWSPIYFGDEHVQQPTVEVQFFLQSPPLILHCAH